MNKECNTCAYSQYQSSTVCKTCKGHDLWRAPTATQTFPDHDPVLKPKHYQLLPGVEVKDVRKVLLDKIEVNAALSYHQADLWSRSWEYLTRFMDKNGLEDLEKAQVYLGWLIEDLKK